jgi:hypothetical protein
VICPTEADERARGRREERKRQARDGDNTIKRTRRTYHAHPLG